MTVWSGSMHHGSRGNGRFHRHGRHCGFGFFHLRHQRNRRIQLHCLFFDNIRHVVLSIIAHPSPLLFPPDHFQSQSAESYVESTPLRHEPRTHASECCGRTAELTIHIGYTERTLPLSAEHRHSFHRKPHRTSTRGQDTAQRAFLCETEKASISQIHKRRALFDSNSS